MVFRISIAFLPALFCCCLCGCKDEESHVPIVYMAVGLDEVLHVWEKQGKTNTFNPSGVVWSSTERYYSFTNEVHDNGQVLRCPGAMAITDDGTTLWIYDKSGKVIISPEKNGIERIDH